METDKTLYLTQVPANKNTVSNLAKLFDECSKVEVSYKGDPGAAAVTFPSHNLASKAFHKSKEVLNKRRIGISWHPQHSYTRHLNRHKKAGTSTAVNIGQENEILKGSIYF